MMEAANNTNMEVNSVGEAVSPNNGDVTPMDFDGFQPEGMDAKSSLMKKRKLDGINKNSHIPIVIPRSSESPNQSINSNAPPQRYQNQGQSSPNPPSVSNTDPNPHQPSTAGSSINESQNFCVLCKKRSVRTTLKLQCSQCQGRAHLSCAKLNKQQAELTPNWHCRHCLNRSLGIDEDNPIPTQTNPVPPNFAEALSSLKSRCKLYRRLPKAVRPLLAGILSEKIDAVLSNPSVQTWCDLQLLTFG